MNRSFPEICAHCKLLRVLKARRICTKCYRNEEIRFLYNKKPTRINRFLLGMNGQESVISMSLNKKRSRKQYRDNCAHCSKYSIIAGRGLCKNCHSIKSIRLQYICKPHYRKHPLSFSEDPLPKVGCGPVTAPPGSILKIAVLQARLEAGLPLFNEEDRCCDEGKKF